MNEQTSKQARERTRKKKNNTHTQYNNTWYNFSTEILTIEALQR